MGSKAALIQVLGFGFILGYISTNLNTIATRAQGNMSRYEGATESHNLAVTGANVGLSRFYQDTTWRGSVTQTLAGAFTGSFTCSVSDLPTGRPMLRSVSRCVTADGILRDTVEIIFGQLRRNSFTLFAYMSNFEGNDFWMTGDTIWGRIHSNGRFHMTGSPVFMQKLTTSKDMDPKWGAGVNNAIFKQGFETGVAPIDYPVDISDLYGAAASGGRTYAGNVDILLNPGSSTNNDGYALVYQGGTLIDSVYYAASGFNGVMLATGSVSVRGTVDGKITLASRTSVRITDDIIYENRDMNPKSTGTVSDDLLGLVADGNVLVGNTTANKTDCVVDACIFSRTGSLETEDLTGVGPCGALRVQGSVVQDDRGKIGVYHVGSGALKNGFNKRFWYDERLADPNFRPPYFPGFWTKTPAIASWWESVYIPSFF